MSYLSTLSKVQNENIQILIQIMNKRAIVNKYAQAGMLAVISKECEFKPKGETSYATTSNGRIREVFGSRVAMYSEDELSNLKLHPDQFFNAIYGDRYGNAHDEGWKYRGRGFNQLTFKDNYKDIGSEMSVDISKFPDRLNEIPIAAEACCIYFLKRLRMMPTDLRAYYKAMGMDDFTDVMTATQCIYHANAGWGKSLAQIKADKTGGLKKALGRCEELLTLIK